MCVGEIEVEKQSKSCLYKLVGEIDPSVSRERLFSLQLSRQERSLQAFKVIVCINCSQTERRTVPI